MELWKLGKVEICPPFQHACTKNQGLSHCLYHVPLRLNSHITSSGKSALKTPSLPQCCSFSKYIMGTTSCQLLPQLLLQDLYIYCDYPIACPPLAYLRQTQSSPKAGVGPYFILNSVWRTGPDTQQGPENSC